MGKFYAGKRIGHAYKIPLTAETPPLFRDAANPADPDPGPAPQNNIAAKTGGPPEKNISIIVAKTHSSAPEPLKTGEARLLPVRPNKQVAVRDDDEWTIWWMILYVLLLCIMIGLLAFLVLWIFVALIQAFVTALLITGILFLFFVAIFIFASLFVGG